MRASSRVSAATRSMAATCSRRSCVHLSQADFGLFLATLELALTLLQLVGFAIEVLLFLPQPPILRLQLGAHLARLLLGRGAGANGLLFGFEQDGLFLGIRAGADLTSARFGQLALVDGGTLLQDVAQPKAEGNGD